MNYELTKSSVFPLVEVTLSCGEEIRIERGSMVYHSGGIDLEGKMNSGGGGLGGFVKALGRSVVSGESVFITSARGLRDGAKIGLAPGNPGGIRELFLGAEQWRICDKAFLAADSTATYDIKRQGVGKALMGGTGGFFVMETRGTGSVLVSSYGDIIELEVEPGQNLVVDNNHVVAWSTGLDYQLKIASGAFGFTTGEGIVNEFYGSGRVLVQTRNISSLAEMLQPYFPQSSD